MSIQGNDLSKNMNGSILVLAGASGTQLINHAKILLDSNQMNQGSDAITISPAADTISITIINNSISNNTGSAFVSYFNQPGPNATLSISNNSISNNLNGNSNASGGISFDGFSAVNALIQNNNFSNNAQGNSIGFYGNSFTAPTTSTVTFTNNQLTESDTFDFEFYGNTSALDSTYIFQQQGSGSCFIVPCNYETANTGGFTLTGVTSSADCSGSSCP